jgi:hypothetical protein
MRTLGHLRRTRIWRKSGKRRKRTRSGTTIRLAATQATIICNPPYCAARGLLFVLIVSLWASSPWPAVAASPSTAIGANYPIDTSPPRDFFDERLLRTLAREASATVVCTLLGLVDVYPEQKDPDVFYDASCEILKVISGSPKGKLLHFIWQVERGSRMPPPRSPLLVYLKARKEPFDGPPLLKWVALDAGVLRYTPALEKKIHHMFKH